jgi:CheY-like chemotaxis protein
MKLSIIVADDVEINIEVMKVNLDSISVPNKVDYCKNGFEAVEIAKN